ncbi:sulfite exporter TauE/SafE family protein [Roseomonas chloroacetimidivorans]|uniref:sulfite exporter TauE/SafE family protein n=1 Tax=Roseomonas chloroacetimidivorans TaxID=1766656 RepID=UPI003C740DB9
MTFILPDLPSFTVLGPVIAIITLSAIFRGFTGFGFAIIAVPLLSLALPPLMAVALSAGLQFLGGLMDVRSAAPHCHWRSVRWLSVGALVASPVGTLLLSWLPADVARLALAAACGTAVLALGAGLGFRNVPGRAATAGVGVLAGLFSGLAAMPGPPTLAYYLASPLPAAQVRASLLVFFLFSATVSFASLIVIGAVGWHEVLMVLAGMPLMLAGSRIGAALFQRAGGAHRGISLATLALIAVITAVRGVAGLLHTAP